MVKQGLLDTKEAADWLGVSPHTLATARCVGGDTPPFVKVGRRVLYDPADLEAFVNARKRLNTSDRGGTAAA